jgi:PI3-kinase family, ras-binding domain
MIDCTLKPADLLKETMRKMRSINVSFNSDRQMVLRICGLNEFLVGDNRLIQFSHIQVKVMSFGMMEKFLIVSIRKKLMNVRSEKSFVVNSKETL